MLYAHPMDLTGCGNYRIMHPIKSLPEDLKNKIKVVMPGELGGITATINNNRVTDVKVPSDCDTVLIQRPTSNLMLEALAVAKQQGVKIIMEVDDDLEELSPAHPMWPTMNTRVGLSAEHDAINPRVCATAIADRVVVSTQALFDKYRKYAPDTTEVVLVRNRIPEAQIEAPWDLPEGEHRIGWPGSPSTHPGDLATLGGAVATIGSQFFVVGGGSDPTSVGVYKTLGVLEDRVTITPAAAFDDWIPTLRQNLTIGLVPLKDTKFNRAKSALKALELAAAGVPVVRNELHEFELLGIGLAATKPRQWSTQVRRILSDKELWKDLQHQGFEIAKANTYEANSKEWAEAWCL